MQKHNEITVILGKKGCGKTSLAWNLIRELPRLLIFDFNREYSGFYTVSTPQDLIAVMKLNFEGNFRVCYQPSPDFDIEEHFTHLSAAVFCIPNMTLLAEEIDLVSNAGMMPDGLKKIINYGRHRGISLIALSRRAHKVPRDLTANADKIYTFAQFEPRDIKYLEEYTGGLSEGEVITLKRTDTAGEFLLWENGTIKRGEINFIDKSLKLL